MQALGITRIAAKAKARLDGVPFHPEGLRFSDGRVLPTYDWIAEPVRRS